MAVNPKPNTQPIYPKEIFTWRAKLTNQIVPFTSIPNVASGLFNTTPLKLGAAGECGAIVWQLQAAMGLNIERACNISIYSRRKGDDDISPRGAFTLQILPGSFIGIATVDLTPILPNDQKAMHFEANEEVFVGLYVTGFTNPIVVYMIGGHY